MDARMLSLGDVFNLVEGIVLQLAEIDAEREQIVNSWIRMKGVFIENIIDEKMKNGILDYIDEAYTALLEIQGYC